MASREEFDKALAEALASFTSKEDGSSSECPHSAAVLAQGRGLHTDNSIVQHIQICDSCAQLFENTQRHQAAYDMHRRTFAAVAEQKYQRTGVLTQAFRPYAWLWQPRALLAQAAIVAVVGGLAFLGIPSTHLTSTSTQASNSTQDEQSVSTVAEALQSMETAAQADPALKPALFQLKSFAKSKAQLTPQPVVLARQAIQQQEQVSSPNPQALQRLKTADTHLMAWEFVTRAQLKAEAGGDSAPASLPQTTIGKDGSITVRLDEPHTLNTDHDRQLWQDCARETVGLHNVVFTSGPSRWLMEAPSFDVQTAGKATPNSSPN